MITWLSAVIYTVDQCSDLTLFYSRPTFDLIVLFISIWIRPASVSVSINVLKSNVQINPQHMSLKLQIILVTIKIDEAPGPNIVSMVKFHCICFISPENLSFGEYIFKSTAWSFSADTAITYKGTRRNNTTFLADFSVWLREKYLSCCTWPKCDGPGTSVHCTPIQPKSVELHNLHFLS